MEFEKLLKVKIYGKILRFFHENQTSIDTARGIATWINEDIKQVKAALEKLADQGLLIAHKASSTTAYSYTRNEKYVEKIGQLLKG